MPNINDIIDGRYRVYQLIGQGGMAAVYRVLNIDLQRYEALKMPSVAGQDPEFIKRFLDEARTVAKLQHPNIAAIHTVSGAGAAQPYFTMELVEGGDLAEMIVERGYLPFNEAVPILRQIAGALDFAHQHDVMHRDIKPANILLKPEANAITAKVVDFGISKAVEETGGKRLTRTGMIIGTPEYMSPEQAGSGAVVDQRTDQYSLAVMAYEMLCGAPPFKQESNTSMMSVMMKHVRDEPLAPSRLNSTLSPSVDAAVLRALAKNPTDRFHSCGEFVEALLDTPLSPPPSPHRAGDGTKSTFPGVAVFLFLIAIIGVALIGFGLSNRNEAPPPVPEYATNPDPGDNPQSPQPVQIQVPSFIGGSEDDATNWLQQNSLKVNTVQTYNSTYSAGIVMSQSPAPQSQVNEGTIVGITVSSGSPPAPHTNIPVFTGTWSGTWPWQGENVPAELVVNNQSGRDFYGVLSVDFRSTPKYATNGVIQVNIHGSWFTNGSISLEETNTSNAPVWDGLSTSYGTYNAAADRMVGKFTGKLADHRQWRFKRIGSDTSIPSASY